MSTKLALTYATIFMAKIEQELTYSRAKIPFWRIFIINIFFIWRDSSESLMDFQHTANAHHNSIKFTFEFSQNSVNFLDCSLCLDQSQRLNIALYQKPKDKDLVLHHNSHHPLYLKRDALLYTQTLRIYKQNSQHYGRIPWQERLSLKTYQAAISQGLTLTTNGTTERQTNIFQFHPFTRFILQAQL